MAIMFDFTKDWTYDLFMEDVDKYNATPMHGVYPSPKASDREKFMTWLKGLVRDFNNANPGPMYDSYNCEYKGDVFARLLYEANFSDYYKDVYGQRPHLDMWFYVHPLGFSMFEDIARTFCATPVDDAINEAIYNRNAF